MLLTFFGVAINSGFIIQPNRAADREGREPGMQVGSGSASHARDRDPRSATPPVLVIVVGGVPGRFHVLVCFELWLMAVLDVSGLAGPEQHPGGRGSYVFLLFLLSSSRIRQAKRQVCTVCHQAQDERGDTVVVQDRLSRIRPESSVSSS